MGSEVEEHITKKYDIKKRLGKGVRMLFYSSTMINFDKLYECCLLTFGMTKTRGDIIIIIIVERKQTYKASIST